MYITVFRKTEYNLKHSSQNEDCPGIRESAKNHFREKPAFFRRLENQRGMTIAELLLAMMIFMLVAVGMTTGIRLAFNQYYTALRTAESHVLYSTLSTVIGDELRYTTIVKTSTGGSGPVTEYQGSAAYRSKYGEGSTLFMVDDDGNRTSGCGQIAYGQPDSTGTDGRKLLLTKSAYPRNLRAKISNLTYNNEEGYFTVTLTIAYKDETLISEDFNVINVPGTKVTQ